jgi:hypothetical protein
MKDDSIYVAVREWQPSQEAGMTSSAEHPVRRPAPRVGRAALADQVRSRALIGRITAVTFVTVEYKGLRIVAAERSER